MWHKQCPNYKSNLFLQPFFKVLCHYKKFNFSSDTKVTIKKKNYLGKVFPNDSSIATLWSQLLNLNWSFPAFFVVAKNNRREKNFSTKKISLETTTPSQGKTISTMKKSPEITSRCQERIFDAVKLSEILSRL